MTLPPPTNASSTSTAPSSQQSQQQNTYLPTPTPLSPVSNMTSPQSPTSRPAASSRPSHPTGALEEENLHTLLVRIDRYGQQLLDRVAPFKLYRWLSLVALLIIFMIRMFLLEGFYIVTYVLAIFILNQFILFLQPKDRASLVAKATSAANKNTNEEDDNQTALPTMDDEEFRPFVRRLPEFKFWYSTTYATTLAFFATFFKAFDVPVYWPVLLFYFVILFVATMRRQWLDMKKLKYVPWDIGSKKVYRSDPKRLSVTKPSVTPNVVAASGVNANPIPTMQVPTKKSQTQPSSPQSVPS